MKRCTEYKRINRTYSKDIEFERKKPLKRGHSKRMIWKTIIRASISCTIDVWVSKPIYIPNIR